MFVMENYCVLVYVCKVLSSLVITHGMDNRDYNMLSYVRHEDLNIKDQNKKTQ